MDEAIPLFQKAWELQPADSSVCDNLGAAFLRKGRLSEATALFEKALNLSAHGRQGPQQLG